jgi:hypothetical protein
MHRGICLHEKHSLSICTAVCALVIIINNFLFYVAPGTPIKEIPWPSTCRNTLWEEGATMKILMLTIGPTTCWGFGRTCRFPREQISKPTTRGEKKPIRSSAGTLPSTQGTGEQAMVSIRHHRGGRGVSEVARDRALTTPTQHRCFVYDVGNQSLVNEYPAFEVR